jgi:hypothetical protein
MMKPSLFANEKNRWFDGSIVERLEHPTTKIYGQLDLQESTLDD